MDLSKAFDTTNHSLLLAKRKAYGFSDQALSFLQRCLCKGFERNIINRSFSSGNGVITGVPQGSILSPLLFNIFLSDIFLWICNSSPMVTLSINTEKNMKKVKNDLEVDFMILHKMFHDNHMVLNLGKCHYIMIGDKNPSHKTALNNKEITCSNKKTFKCSSRQKMEL